MCDLFSALGRLSVAPVFNPAQIARISSESPWMPCEFGCCLLPDDVPDAWSLRELLSDLGDRHRVEGVLVFEEEEALVALLVEEGVVSTTTLWRHPTPCREVLDVIPLALRRLRDAG